MKKLHIIFILSVYALLLGASSNAFSFSVRVDRFDVSGSSTFTDDFDDSAAGGWTNFNGIDTYGTWEDEVGNSFANLRSPGLVRPHVSGTPGLYGERSDMFSHLIAGSIVNGSNGDFDGLITFDAVLPGIDETYFMVLNYLDSPTATYLTDGIFLGLTNVSPQLAALLGAAPGLTLSQFHFEYGPGLAITNTTDFSYTLLSIPQSIDTLQIGLQYTDLGGADEIIGGYRFDSTGSLVSPLAAINIDTGIHSGFWDIAASHAFSVPIPPALWFFGSGLLGLVGIARCNKAA